MIIDWGLIYHPPTIPHRHPDTLKVKQTNKYPKTCVSVLGNWIRIVGGLFSLKWGVVKIKIVKCFLIMLMMLYSWPSHLLTTVVVFLLMLNFDKVQPIYFVCCEIGQFLSIFWLRKNKIKGEGREVTNFVRTLTKWMAGVEIWLAKRPEPQESLGDPSETLEVWEAQDSAHWPLSQWQSAANLISFKLYTAKLLKHETDPIKGINRKTAKDTLIWEQF